MLAHCDKPESEEQLSGDRIGAQGVYGWNSAASLCELTAAELRPVDSSVLDSQGIQR